MSKVSTIGSTMPAPDLAMTAGVGKRPSTAAGIHKVSKEFEKLMLHEMLEAAKVGGEDSGGYHGMIVDALTDGVASAGGLGLARQIEEVLSRPR